MLVPAHELDVKDGNQAIYNGFDCALTYEIDEVRQSLRRNDTLIYDFELGMQGPALEMMTRGFRVDIAAREDAIISTEARRKSTAHIVESLVAAVKGSCDSKLPNSPTQLQDLFYNKMKLSPIELHRSGETKRPMNRETLEKLALQDKFAEPIIRAILLQRDMTKTLQVLETDIEDCSTPNNPLNWRWKCSYNIGGTSTGRWSSSKSPFVLFDSESGAWSQGGNNFQNVTEELRRIFIPDPGWKLYGIDKAQSEARDVGWFCGVVLGDWSYLNACESGDLHTYVTRLLYPEWEWTGDLKKDRQLAERRFYRMFTYRDASKRLGHGTNYLGKPEELSKQTHIPLHLVREFQRRYFAAFPCIQRMHEWIAGFLQRERYLVNSFGRRRDFFDRPDANDTIKGAVAYMFQSATGDALNLGLYRLWKRMGTRVQILSQLHDAVYFQYPICSEREEQDMLHEAIDCVQVEQVYRGINGQRKMVIPGEAVGGFNWAHKFRLRADGSSEEWNPKGLVGIRLQ